MTPSLMPTAPTPLGDLAGDTVGSVAGAAEPPPSHPARAVSRRSVLRAAGIGGATILVAGTGVLSYRVFDNGVLDSGSGTPYDAWTNWRTDPSPLGAVAAAILAANPHNTQPWLFHVAPDRIEISSDPSRTMPAVDPFAREHQVGLGCALENLALGLTARGFEPSLLLMPDPADPGHVATVTFVPATLVPTTFAPVPGTISRLYDAIGERHSNRGPYRAADVEQTILDGLVARTADLAGVAVRWFTLPAEKAALTSVILSATEAFIADTGQSEEAFSWFRNNRDEIDRYRDGPTLDAQGLAPMTLALAKILPASSRAAGDRFWLDQTRTVHTATAAAYGIITAADAEDVVSRLTAGRLLQRIHLSATAGGIGLQHMNQVTERIDRERDQGMPPTFAPRLQRVLDRPGRQSLVTFRLGHPVRAALRSPRRALGSVTS